METKRVELSDGQWADVKPMTGTVARQISIGRHQRGMYDTKGELLQDGTLDLLEAMPHVIAAWSLEREITRDVTDELAEMDLLKIWLAAKGGDVPNPSTPSSEDTATKGRRAKARSNGS